MNDRVSLFGTEGQCLFSNNAAAERSCGNGCQVCVPLIKTCQATGNPSNSVFRCDGGSYCEVRAYPDRSVPGVNPRVLVLGCDVTVKMTSKEEVSSATRSLRHAINTSCANLLLNLELFKDVFEDAKPILDAHYSKMNNLLLGNLPYEEYSSHAVPLLDEMIASTKKIVHVAQILRRISTINTAVED